jgi:hypothetical protein
MLTLKERITYISDELGNNGEWLGGINSQTRAIERGVAHAVRVEVASISIAQRGVPRANAAVGTRASSLLGDRARMRSIGSRNRVGLPDIHLVTARTIHAGTGIRVAG